MDLNQVATTAQRHGPTEVGLKQTHHNRRISATKKHAVRVLGRFGKTGLQSRHWILPVQGNSRSGRLGGQLVNKTPHRSKSIYYIPNRLFFMVDFTLSQGEVLMGYNFESWKNRIAERSDLTTKLIHLTKPSTIDGKKKTSLENLQNIITTRQIFPSNTSSGFINGSRGAVCFQDAPLYAACQNTYFEQKVRKETKSKKIRYIPIGIMFDKSYVFKKGGRPVIYEETKVAKNFLPETEWWRIVNFDLSDEDKIIDWTHEREWRCPDQFKFSLNQVSLIFVKSSDYRKFVHWDNEQKIPILHKIRGITVMSDLLF